MLLAVDMGNTNIVVGLMDDTRIVSSFRIVTDRTKDCNYFYEEIARWLNALAEQADAGISSKIALPDAGILSSVVPELDEAVADAMERIVGRPVVQLRDPQLDFGIKIEVDNPAALGRDRIADVVGAMVSHPLPLMTIDMGTATTITVVDANRRLIGGMIIPGVRTSLTALSSHASQLPEIEISAPAHVIARNTLDCMRSGILYGTAAMIDGLIDRIAEELGTMPSVIATGGLGSIIVPHCRHEIDYDPDLLLKGLAMIMRPLPASPRGGDI